MGSQAISASQVNLAAGSLAAPASGTTGFGIDTSGFPTIVDPSGRKAALAVAGGMQSIVALSAWKVLPSGFAEYWTDLNGAADHSFSFGVNQNASSCASVTTESGGKRRLTTQNLAGVAEIMPYYNQVSANQLLPTMFNPKLQPWYAEGRAAIETHGSNSLIFPVSIALTTGGVMTPTLASNTFVALGLAGTGFTGGSNSFLSFAASSAGTMLLQTTTIPWTSVPQSYALYHDGAGTITAKVYAPDGSMQVWTTQNLNQIFVTGGGGGFHPNQWVFATDTTPTTMLCDYLAGYGPRV